MNGVCVVIYSPSVNNKLWGVGGSGWNVTADMAVGILPRMGWEADRQTSLCHIALLEAGLCGAGREQDSWFWCERRLF